MTKTQRLSTLTILAAAVCVIVGGCTSTPPAPEQPQQIPAPGPGWAYDQFVRDHITLRMLEAKPAGLCPKYDELADQKIFWVKFVQAVAKAESNYNPASVYVEKTQGKDPVTGAQTTSEGLLQLSYKDTIHTYYRNLPAVQEISWAKKNLQDPFINLAAGMAIMDDRIHRAGPDVVSALAPYWSTVREYRVKILPTLKTLLPACF